MAELLKQILLLPRDEQLRIIALVAANLQMAEEEAPAEVDTWLQNLLTEREQLAEEPEAKRFDRQSFKEEVEKRIQARKSA
ncbi:MAG: hypothetical protein AAF927_21345 [Bacteroidota bacterium]